MKKQIFKENKKSVLLLELFIPQKDGKKQISIRGSGFIVTEDGKFVTSAHVYNNIPESKRKFLRVVVADKTNKKGITFFKKYGLNLLELDNENDIALMKIETKDDKTFPAVNSFGNLEEIAEGDDAVFVGFPLAIKLLEMGFGLTMSMTHCMISSVKRRAKDGSLHFYIVDTHINNGLSGSPLFSVENGELIGIAAGKIILNNFKTKDGQKVEVPANMGICRPINYVVDLINKNKEENKDE